MAIIFTIQCDFVGSYAPGQRNKTNIKKEKSRFGVTRQYLNKLRVDSIFLTIV